MRVSRDFSRLPQMESMLAGYLNWAFDGDPLSSAEAPAGYPNKNSNNRKNRKRAGDDGKRETPGALFFFLPSLPAD